MARNTLSGRRERAAIAKENNFAQVRCAGARACALVRWACRLCHHGRLRSPQVTLRSHAAR
jgi:hypothetical protein